MTATQKLRHKVNKVRILQKNTDTKMKTLQANVEAMASLKTESPNGHIKFKPES